MNSDFRLAVGYLRHPKTKMLKRKMGEASVLSHIQLLEFTALHRPDGVLSGLNAEEIAIAADWEGDGEAFVSALVERGLLDRRDDGVLCVHDWIEHNPWAAGAVDRSSKAKKAADARWSKGNAPGTQGNAEAHNAPNATSMAEQCAEHGLAYAPLLSSPILSSPNPPEEERPPVALGSATAPPPVKSARKSAAKTPYDREGLRRFYALYPKKKDPDAVAAAWDKLMPDAALQEKIIANVRLGIASQDWYDDAGRAIPYPATYLNNSRWEDEYTPLGSVPARASPNGRSLNGSREAVPAGQSAATVAAQREAERIRAIMATREAGQ